MDSNSNNDESYDCAFKVVVVGDSLTGKSSLLSRYTKNTFYEGYIPTVAVDFASRNVKVNEKAIKANVWDTAGREEYITISTRHYRGAAGAIIVYDITDRETFEHVDKWMKGLNNYGKEGLPIVLVGNKSDLEDKRKVAKAEAMAYAEEKQFQYIETSAKDSTNVQEAFQTLLAEILDKIRKREDEELNPSQIAGVTVPEVPPPDVASDNQDTDESEAEAIDIPGLAVEIIRLKNGFMEKFDKFSRLEDKVDKLCDKVDQLETRMSALESELRENKH